MESEEEDVIFENSVLHQFWKEAGGSEIETEPRPTTSLYAGIQDSLVNENDKTSKSSPSSLKCLLGDDYQQLFGLPQWVIYLFVSPATVESLYQAQMQQTLKRLLSSKLLLDDDRCFLSNLMEEDAKPEQLIPRRQYLDLLRIMPVILIVANVAVMTSVYLPGGLALITACLGFPLVGGSVTAVLILWATLCAGSLALIVTAVQTWLTNKISTEFSSRESHLVGFEKAALELLHAERKCLRIIQESEMVARGFTIASQRHLMSRFESSGKSVVDQLCPELRDLIVVGNQGLMTGVGDVVERMTRDIPGVSPVSKFNPLGGLMGMCQAKTKSPLEDPTAASAAEDLTPGVIKASVDLLGLFLSGLMCRMALCYHQENLEESFNPYVVTVEPVKSLLPVVISLKSSLTSCYSLLRAVHTTPDAAELPGDDAKTEERKKGRNTASQIETLYTCVHSLDLHLQSVLQVTRELTVTLEEKLECETRGADPALKEKGMTHHSGVSHDEQESWEDVLRQVKVGLDSCLECHQESVKKLKLREETADVRPAPVKAPPAAPAQVSTRPVHIPSEDPVIEDEVFEGVTDISEDHEDLQPRRYTDEDRAKLKMFREMAKSLRKELEAVVGEKAKEQQIREERALARVKGREKSKTHGAESSEVDSLNSACAQEPCSTDDTTTQSIQSTLKNSPSNRKDVCVEDEALRLEGTIERVHPSEGDHNSDKNSSTNVTFKGNESGGGRNASLGPLLNDENLEAVGNVCNKDDEGQIESVNSSTTDGLLLCDRSIRGVLQLDGLSDVCKTESMNAPSITDDLDPSTTPGDCAEVTEQDSSLQNAPSGSEHQSTVNVGHSLSGQERDENDVNPLSHDLTLNSVPSRDYPIPKKRKSVKNASEEKIDDMKESEELSTGSDGYNVSCVESAGKKGLVSNDPAALCETDIDIRNQEIQEEKVVSADSKQNSVQQHNGGGEGQTAPSFFSPSSFSLTSSIAAMAANRARLLQDTSNVETFGDSSSSEEDSS